jgi:hypothetical protein
VFLLKCSLPQPNWATANICNKAAAFFIMFIVSARIWNKFKTVGIYFQEIFVNGNCTLMKPLCVTITYAAKKKAKVEKLRVTLHTWGWAKRQLRSTKSKFQILLCATVGTASHQLGLEVCTMYGISGNMLKDDKAIYKWLLNISLRFSFDLPMYIQTWYN